MQYKFIVGIVMLLGVVAITGAGCSTDTQKGSPIDSSTKIPEKEEAMETEKNAMMKKEDSAPEEKIMTANAAGMYKDYSPSALAEATKNGGKAVLFFWASWCPACKTANAEFLTNANEIPSNVTILKTNYDTEKALKTKYGIIYQHTFVQVDAQGNPITKWNGGGVSELLTNLR